MFLNRFAFYKVFSALTLAIALFAYVAPARAQEGEPSLIPLYKYKPTYFLLGNPYTKVQISFKTQVVENLPIYFGYTQLMMWDLPVAEPFFYDVNYNPLVWYRFNLNGDRQQWLDFIPYEHESNGKGAAGERSWNRIGVLYHQKNTLGDRARLYWDVKAWVPYGYEEHNPDLPEYRGVWELTMTFADIFGPTLDFDDLIFRLYPGGPSRTDPTHGGQEMTLRLKGTYRTFLPLVVLQLFHGYGEYLQDYQDDRWEFRVGLGF